QYEQRKGAASAGAYFGSRAGQAPQPGFTLPPVTVTEDAPPPANDWKPLPPPGGGGRDAAAAAASREAEAVRELIAELEEELRLVGASDTEKRISAELRRANVDAASAEGQAIANLVREIEAEADALERAKKAAEQQKEAIGNLFDMGEDALLAMLDNS